MYIGTEIVVAIVFFIPIIVLLVTVGYELQINDFSLIVEGATRLIPFPEDFSETYLELRILGAYQFLESGPFSLKFNIGQVSAELVEKAFQLHFVPKIGGTLEFHNLKLSVNYVNKAFIVRNLSEILILLLFIQSYYLCLSNDSTAQRSF